MVPVALAWWFQRGRGWQVSRKKAAQIALKTAYLCDVFGTWSLGPCIVPHEGSSFHTASQCITWTQKMCTRWTQGYAQHGNDQDVSQRLKQPGGLGFHFCSDFRKVSAVSKFDALHLHITLMNRCNLVRCSLLSFHTRFNQEVLAFLEYILHSIYLMSWVCSMRGMFAVVVWALSVGSLH